MFHMDRNVFFDEVQSISGFNATNVTFISSNPVTLSDNRDVKDVVSECILCQTMKTFDCIP